MKTSIIIVFFLIAYCNGQGTSVAVGNERPGEILVYDRTITEPSRPNSIVTHTVALSDTSILITRVIVRPTNPRITSIITIRGGPGRSSVIIVLRSRRGSPILYRVRIYAVRIPFIVAHPTGPTPTITPLIKDTITPTVTPSISPTVTPSVSPLPTSPSPEDVTEED